MAQTNLLGLTWQHIRDGLRDPAQIKVVWDVLWYRKYTQPLSQWTDNRFSMYVRKDVVTSIWQYGAVAAALRTNRHRRRSGPLRKGRARGDIAEAMGRRRRSG